MRSQHTFRNIGVSVLALYAPSIHPVLTRAHTNLSRQTNCMCSRRASFGTTVTTTTVCRTTYLYNPISNVECSTAMNLTQSTVTDIHSLCIDYHSRWSQKPKHFHTHVYRLIHKHTCIVLLYLLSFIFAHAIKGKQMRSSFFLSLFHSSRLLSPLLVNSFASMCVSAY